MFSLMSLMYSKKSIGPRTEPCGTPDVTSVMSDRAPLTETRCLRFDRKDVIQLCVPVSQTPPDSHVRERFLSVGVYSRGDPGIMGYELSFTARNCNFSFISAFC